MLKITAAGTCRSKWGYISRYKHWCVHVLRLVDQWNKMFLWTCYRVDKLKIILSHDFNAVASSMLDYTALLDIEVSTPDFTLKIITLSFHYQPCHLIINHLLHPFWYRKIQLLTEFCSLYKYFIEINRNFKHCRFLVGRKKTS